MTVSVNLTSGKMPPIEEVIIKIRLVITKVLRFLGNSLNIPVLQIAGILTASVIFATYYYNFDYTLQLHVAFTTSGLALLTSEAIMLMANKQFCGPLTDRQNALIHGFLVTFGLILTITGNIIIINQKASKNLRHFETVHGITGLSSMLFILLAFILGLISLVSKYMINSNIINITNDTVKWFLLPHHIFGSLGYGIGMGSLCYGMNSPEFVTKTDYYVRLILIIFTIIVTSWTMICSFYELCDILKGLVRIYDPNINVPRGPVINDNNQSGTSGLALKKVNRNSNQNSKKSNENVTLDKKEENISLSDDTSK